MREIIADALERTDIFGATPYAIRESIGTAMERTVVRYEGDRIIFDRGSRLTSLPFLVEGRAVAEINSEDGHRMLVERFRAPEILASSILFSPRQLLPVTVRSEGYCIMASITKGELLHYCRKDQAVLTGLLNDMGHRTAFLAARLRLSEFASLRQRIAVFLLEEASQQQRLSVHLSQSREELADLFGVARPSLSRELGAMSREGLISCHESAIDVLDVEGLRSLKSGCD